MIIAIGLPTDIFFVSGFTQLINIYLCSLRLYAFFFFFFLINMILFYLGGERPLPIIRGVSRDMIVIVDVFIAFSAFNLFAFTSHELEVLLALELHGLERERFKVHLQVLIPACRGKSFSTPAATSLCWSPA